MDNLKTPDFQWSYLKLFEWQHFALVRTRYYRTAALLHPGNKETKTNDIFVLLSKHALPAESTHRSVQAQQQMTSVSEQAKYLKYPHSQIAKGRN